MNEGCTAHIGIGASLGAREAAVLRAARGIESIGAGVLVRLSSLYETVPIGMVSEAPFVNAVASVRTLLSPDDLLKRLKTMEKRMGRTGGHMEPREIDLDLIACGETCCDSAGLTLPHPRYRARAFVLIPLSEVAPDFVCPATGSDIMTMTKDVDSTGVVRISTRQIVEGSYRDR